MSNMDEFTLSLLTNAEVLAVNQDSTGNHELFHEDCLVAWIADPPNSTDKYLALFNTRDAAVGTTARVAVDLAPLGFVSDCRVRDLWAHKELGVFRNEFAMELPSHGAGMFRLSHLKAGSSESTPARK